MNDLTISVSSTFMRDYGKAGINLQHLAEGAVKDLLRRAESDPSGWRRLYDKVAGLAGRVLEIDLAGGPRMLALDDTDLILWRMGNHDLINRVTRDKPPLPDSKSTDPLPPQFMPDSQSRLFPPDRSEPYVDYGNERAADWIYWLDDQQYAAAVEILTDIEDRYLEGECAHSALLGGPGTGKTTILVWLLKQLADFDEYGAELNVRLIAPPAVVNQIQQSTGWQLDAFTLSPSHVAGSDPGHDGDPVDVVLLDDPGSLVAVDHVMDVFPGASIVVGFDPLQMNEAETDADLDEWAERQELRLEWFNSSYRQKEVVGSAAKHVADVVAASSPFLREDKKEDHREERKQLTERSNELRFPNPSGTVQTFPEANWEDWDSYWKGLYRLRTEGRLWDHWPPLLVIRDPSAEIDERWLKRIDPMPSHRTALDDLLAVKGLEYQHVLILLSQRVYQTIENGFEGRGRREWNQYRLFRIPFSRAKDSLTTFVFPSI